MENYNSIELTAETYEEYKEALENGSYEDETYATCDGRMVTIENPTKNSNYRYELRYISGRYISKTNDVHKALWFLKTGEYIDCYDGKAKIA